MNGGSKKDSSYYDFFQVFQGLCDSCQLAEYKKPCINSMMWTNLMPRVSFYTPLKHQKIKGFVMFSGGLKRKKDQWHEMG